MNPLRIAGWTLMALGAILLTVGALSDVSVAIPASYANGYSASRVVNTGLMFGALRLLLIGGFVFVAGAVLAAQAGTGPASREQSDPAITDATRAGSEPATSPPLSYRPGTSRVPMGLVIALVAAWLLFVAGIAFIANLGSAADVDTPAETATAAAATADAAAADASKAAADAAAETALDAAATADAAFEDAERASAGARSARSAR